MIEQRAAMPEAIAVAVSSGVQSSCTQQGTLIHELKIEATQQYQLLREDNAKIEAVARCSRDLICEIDGARHIASASVDQAVFGWKADDLCERDVLELIHPDDHAQLQQQLERLRITGPESAELRMLHRNGSWLAVEASGASYQTASGEQRVVLLFRDISERVRMMQQLSDAERREQVGRRASEIAHEFNNLLTVIQGFTDVALGISLDTRVRDNLQRIRSAAERAAELTRQLLELSRR